VNRPPCEDWHVDRCAECGFEYRLDEADRARVEITGCAAALGDILRDGDVDLRSRREPRLWSPLEYGCHVRDVLIVQRERVLRARREERPSFAPMGRDERVEHDGYATQDPRDVARQLTDAAALFAHVLDRLGREDWEREVTYNYPRHMVRSLRWVAVHTAHELRHHLQDVHRQLPGR
jgi:DinB superfamily